jgi:hypothetical protein
MWREMRIEDRWAKQTAYLMNATGNFKQSVTPEQILGRDLLHPDPRHVVAPAPALSEDDKEILAEKQARAEMLAIELQFRQAAAEGHGPQIVSGS